MMKKTTLSLLISALSGIATAQQIIVFGDSLSDIGQQGWAHKASYYQNGIANPLYNETLAHMLGSKIQSSTNGGTNYAYSGGVAVGTNSERSTTQPNIVVQKQIQDYLAKGVNPNDLHLVWVGGNDMAAILARALGGSNPVGEVISGSTESAQASAMQWATLKQAGVETGIFPTVPNVLYTPEVFQKFGEVAGNTIKQFAKEKQLSDFQANMVGNTFQTLFKRNVSALNTTHQQDLNAFVQARTDVLTKTVADLYNYSDFLLALVGYAKLGDAITPYISQQTATQMLIAQYQKTAEQATRATSLLNESTTKALNKVGGNIVRLDIDGLFLDLLSRPEAYGLNNTVGVACKTTTTSACTTPAAGADQMLFADSFHPNTIAHKVMADYIYTTLHSPKEMVLLPRLAERNNEIALDFARNESHGNRLNRQEERTVTAIAAHQQHQDGNSTHVGLKAQFNPEWQLSAVVSQQKQDGSLGNTKAQSKTKSFNTLLRYDANQWWLGSSLQVSSSDYKTQRSVTLGSASHTQQAETTGAVISASLFGGYEWKFDRNIIATLSDLTYSNNKIANFGEKNVGPTRLEFAEQKTNDLKTGIGAEYRYQGEQFQPFVSARWVKGWINKDQQLDVRLNGSQFNVKQPKTDRSWVNLQAGVNYHFVKRPFNLTAYVSQDLGRKNKIGGTTANLGMSYQF